MRSALVTFDFTKFAGAVVSLPEVRPAVPERVQLGQRLLQAMIDETCNASFLVSLPEEAFYAAGEILAAEESDDPHIQAASEEIEWGNSFHELFHRIVRLAFRPDPSLAAEFI